MSSYLLSARTHIDPTEGGDLFRDWPPTLAEGDFKILAADGPHEDVEGPGDLGDHHC
jgi:hypothetical protein